MAKESISKIAYKTLQQSKSIAGFAHKQISSRLMNFILPDSKLENFDIDKDLLIQIQNSMDILREEDWNDAEKNIYPKKLLFDEPWLRYLTQYPKIWLDMPNTWDRRRWIIQPDSATHHISVDHHRIVIMAINAYKE